MATPQLEAHDIQGLVRHAYRHLPWSAYLLLAFDSETDGDLTLPGNARRWLAAQMRAIRSCAQACPDESMTIAFTHGGLTHFGLSGRGGAGFSPAFIDGMASQRRQAILGDDVSDWQWGRGETPIDVLVVLYRRDKASLERRTNDIAKQPGVRIVQSLRAQARPDRCEHFGFVDGLSQPVLEGFRKSHKRHVHPRDVVRDGEFVLGYTNEYGYASTVPQFGGNPTFGRNGTYLVFRQLAQDVAGFRAFLKCQAGGAPEAQEELAAKMVGRWKNGAPLVLAPDFANPVYDSDSPDPATRAQANDFGYTTDRAGLRCPLGAHIRRANPRDVSANDDPRQALSHTARHRLLRRGRSYGPQFDDAPNCTERGLQFVALCADIERQFEFVQQTWLNNPAFNDLDEIDPLVGAPSGNATFTIQNEIARQRVFGLKQFVTTRGGAYFFVPGIAALQWLAGTSAAAPAVPGQRAQRALTVSDTSP